jgi:LmbE family N-acetylglucosaminyl deacetylase
MKILVIAPHADDEALGCGGTMARLVAEGHNVTVAVLTGHGDEAPHPIWTREVWDTVRGEAREACNVLGVRELIFREVPAAQVAEHAPWQLNGLCADVVRETAPDVLFVPFLYDLHKDHREFFHALSTVWRPASELGRSIRAVYAYETVSETHWNFANVEPGFVPNVYVDIGDHLETKLEALACYASQMRPYPDARSLESIRAQAIWRGCQVGMRAAEGFVLVRQYAPGGLPFTV